MKNPLSPGSARPEGGFTLIELVVVISILGILAATAMPKFIGMSTDARIAAVNGMAGALRSAAALTVSKCAMSPGCSPSSPSGTMSIGGVTKIAYYGYPIESSGRGYWGIDERVDYSGFTYSNAAYFAYFDSTGAPTPSTCRVSYKYQDAADLPPVITVTTSGC